MGTKHNFEIEIKSLLGEKEKADELKRKMRAADPKLVEIGSHKQLNHYFIPLPTEPGKPGGDLRQLYENTKDVVEKTKLAKFKALAERAKDYSVRTRWADGKTILVIKATIDDTTSSNGTARLEWESAVTFPEHSGFPEETNNLDFLRYLDDRVRFSGFEYQAKWSRERQEFKYKGANVSIDKNAGYGYLSEFEMVVDDQKKADETKSLLRGLMGELGIDELPQDRLARMFDYYNKNWQDYYGTENIFTIE